jgi:hypothetical protein
MSVALSLLSSSHCVCNHTVLVFFSLLVPGYTFMSPSQEPKKKLQYTRPTNVEKGTDESFRLSSPCDPLSRFFNHPVGPRCAMRLMPIFCLLVLSVRVKLSGFHAGWRHCREPSLTLASRTRTSSCGLGKWPSSQNAVQGRYGAQILINLSFLSTNRALRGFTFGSATLLQNYSNARNGLESHLFAKIIVVDFLSEEQKNGQMQALHLVSLFSMPVLHHDRGGPTPAF